MGEASKEVKRLEERIAATQSSLSILEESLMEWRKKADIEAQVGLYYRPVPTQVAYRIYQLADGSFDYESVYSEQLKTDKSPLFETEAQAVNFAEAFQVMLEMRAQPGIIAPEPHQQSAVIVPQRNGEVSIIKGPCRDAVPSTLFARFDTEASASAAVKKVGKNRIVKAARTFQFM